MVAGFRDLVPQFRRVQGLEFDVMPIPVIEGSGTIGDITGLCISSQSTHTPRRPTSSPTPSASTP